MVAPILPKLKYSIVHNFLNSLPILVKLASKFMICKVLICFKVAFPFKSSTFKGWMGSCGRTRWPARPGPLVLGLGFGLQVTFKRTKEENAESGVS